MILLVKLLRMIGLYSVSLLGILNQGGKTIQEWKKYFGNHLTTEEGNNDSKEVMLYDVPTLLEK